jgi:hypothetical protein
MLRSVNQNIINSRNTATCFGYKSSAGRTKSIQKGVNFKTAIQFWDLKPSQVKNTQIFLNLDFENL